MDIKKKLLTVVLSAVLILSLAVPAVAATSSPKNPGYKEVDGKGEDFNSQDHKGKDDLQVTTIVSTGPHITIKVTSRTGKPTAVDINIARDKNNKKIAIKRLGDTKNGVFNNKNGQNIETVQVKSPAAKVTISANAFKGSKVSKLKLLSKEVHLASGCFDGTKVKNPTITIGGTKRKASSITFKKSSWKGLNKKAKIIVRKSSMTKAEFNKLKKKLVRSGYPGKIYYR